MSPMDVIGWIASSDMSVDALFGTALLVCFAAGAVYAGGQSVLAQFFPQQEEKTAKPAAQPEQAKVDLGEDRSHERFVKTSREYRRREGLEREEAAQRELREAEQERIAYEQEVMLEFLGQK